MTIDLRRCGIACTGVPHFHWTPAFPLTHRIRPSNRSDSGVRIYMSVLFEESEPPSVAEMYGECWERLIHMVDFVRWPGNKL